MIFNKCNQLHIEENDTIHDECYDCPSCGSKCYSSCVMEKVTTKSPISNTISIDSIGPDKIIFCKCDCGHTWLEFWKPNHHRSLIRGTTMKNYLEFGALKNFVFDVNKFKV